MMSALEVNGRSNDFLALQLVEFLSMIPKFVSLLGENNTDALKCLLERHLDAGIKLSLLLKHTLFLVWLKGNRVL